MLTDAQLAARKGKMTASRVGMLMSGNADLIGRLYLEFIGDVEPEDLSDNWFVQLGTVTESLQLDWYERKNRHPVTRRGEVVTHSKFEWAAATLDGFDAEIPCPIECKWVARFLAQEAIIDSFQPQLQWQMWVTGTDCCALSISRGGAPPVVDYIDRAQGYLDEMVARADHFMMCVAMRTPPVTLPAIQPPVDPTKVVDMTGNNAWSHYATGFLQHYGAAHEYEDCKLALKELVPADAIRAFGHGIRITRDRRGSLRITRDEREEDANG